MPVKAPISLQDLRRRIYTKAKAEESWRFWGLYTHICKRDTLREAYRLAKENNGAPGVDGVTFEAIETSGVEAFLQQLQDALPRLTATTHPPAILSSSAHFPVLLVIRPTLLHRFLDGTRRTSPVA